MSFAHINWGPGHAAAGFLLAAREDDGRALADVAAAARLEPARLEAIEAGRVLPTHDEAEALVAALALPDDAALWAVCKLAEAREDADYCRDHGLPLPGALEA